ncbi:MAG: S8/S53 family peptidase [Ktedonobacterales bacterium]|nr:S8/S53 family peptidase [Ktedonobacterales bacterium]
MTARTRWLAVGMSCTLIIAALGLVARQAIFVQAAPQQLAQVPHSAPQFTASVTPIGKLPQNGTMSLTLTLQPRNKAMLERFVQDVATPHSAHFHQFLAPQNFASVFGPDPATVRATVKYLQSAGLHVTKLQSGGMFISVTGTVKAVEAALHTTMNTYHDAKGRTFFANSAGVTLPANIAPHVIGVTGLDNLATHHRMTTNPSATKKKLVQKPNTAGCPATTGQNTLVPAQLATAYDFPATLTGAGQSVALIEFDGYLLSDIGAYAACFAPSVTVSNVVQTRAIDLGGPLTPEVGAIEDELDIEVLLGMAPGLSKIHVYEAPNSNQGLIDMLAAIANDDADATVSDSWGACETDTGFAVAASEEMAFLQMAAQGQGVYVASGDNAAYDCLNDLGSATYFHGQSVSVDDPASDPYVVAVGGTTLNINATTASYLSETVWNNIDLPSPVQAGTGGGISQLWGAPEWQSGARATTTPGGIADPSGGRALPDVAANADPQTGYAEYCTAGDFCASAPGSWFDIGGTSAAAPLWASLAALAAQGANMRVGLITPALYSLYRADTTAHAAAGITLNGTTYYDYATQVNGATPASGQITFNDITSGNNTFPSAAGFAPGFSARPGFDAVSGLGTMDGQSVVDFLKASIRFTSPRLYMAARGNDGRFWLSGYFLNNGNGNLLPSSPQLSNWFPLSSQAFQGNPAVVDNGAPTAGLTGTTGMVWIAGIGTDGLLRIGSYNPSTTTFSGWTTAPGSPLCKGNPAAAYAGAKLLMTCQTTSGALMLVSYTPGSNSWAAWSTIGGGLTDSPTMTTDGTNLLLYAQTNQNDWFNTVTVSGGTLGVWRHMATTCESTPAVAFTGTANQFVLSCIAHDTSTMWANTFNLGDGTLSGWFNLGSPSGIGLKNATAVSVDLLDNPGVTLFTGEGKNGAAYVQLMTDNPLYSYVAGWSIASQPGIFAANPATDYFGV